MSLLTQDVYKHIRRIQIKTTRTVNDLLAGAYHSAFKGRGIEFEDVREYQPGDEVRTIDWNVTARSNTPYVKNFREERELTVLLLVDVSVSSHFGSTDRQKSELIAEIAAVLAFSAIKNNDKVGLILFSDRIEYYIPPKKGVRHVLRVIRELLIFEPKGKGTDISQALTFLGKVQKRQGVCFLISDFIGENYEKEITITAKKYDLISILIQDPYEISFPNVNLITIRDLETGEIKLIDSSDPSVQEYFLEERRKSLENHLELMKKIGAGSIEIECGKPYVDPLRTFFKLREKKR